MSAPRYCAHCLALATDVANIVLIWSRPDNLDEGGPPAPPVSSPVPPGRLLTTLAATEGTITGVTVYGDVPLPLYSVTTYNGAELCEPHLAEHLGPLRVITT